MQAIGEAAIEIFSPHHRDVTSKRAHFFAPCRRTTPYAGPVPSASRNVAQGSLDSRSAFVCWRQAHFYPIETGIGHLEPEAACSRGWADDESLLGGLDAFNRPPVYLLNNGGCGY